MAIRWPFGRRGEGPDKEEGRKEEDPIARVIKASEGPPPVPAVPENVKRSAEMVRGEVADSLKGGLGKEGEAAVVVPPPVDFVAISRAAVETVHERAHRRLKAQMAMMSLLPSAHDLIPAISEDEFIRLVEALRKAADHERPERFEDAVVILKQAWPNLSSLLDTLMQVQQAFLNAHPGHPSEARRLFSTAALFLIRVLHRGEVAKLRDSPMTPASISPTVPCTIHIADVHLYVTPHASAPASVLTSSVSKRRLLFGNGAQVLVGREFSFSSYFGIEVPVTNIAGSGTPQFYLLESAQISRGALRIERTGDGSLLFYDLGSVNGISGEAGHGEQKVHFCSAARQGGKTFSLK